jgi:hypothetical protein
MGNRESLRAKGCGAKFYFIENPKQRMICGIDYLCDDCKTKQEQEE